MPQNEKQLTACQMLIERINTVDDLRSLKSWLSKNKDKIHELNRQQLINAVIWFDDTDRRAVEIENDAIKYYNNTFKTQE